MSSSELLSQFLAVIDAEHQRIQFFAEGNLLKVQRELQIEYIEVPFTTEGVYLKCPKATVDIISFCWTY